MTRKERKLRWVSDVHWRKEGQQPRSMKTQNALMDAAEALVLEKGFEATSISDIAELAGYSTGSVYHHFKDKKALFFASYQRMAMRFKEVVEELSDPQRWTGASVEDLLRGYAEVMLESFRANEAARAAALAVTLEEPELAAEYAGLMSDSRARLLQLILDRKEELGGDSVEERARLVIDQLASMIVGWLDPLQEKARGSRMEDAKFLKETVHMLCCYLQVTTTAN